MLVMGGANPPNPSNEVNIYNPANNTSTVGSPVPSFFTARRNFPTDNRWSTTIGWEADANYSDEHDGNLQPMSDARARPTTVDDHNDGVVRSTDCTLREATHHRDANAGRIISFAPGVTGTIQSAAALPTLKPTWPSKVPARICSLCGATSAGATASSISVPKM